MNQHTQEQWVAAIEALAACYAALENVGLIDPDFDEVQDAEAKAEAILFPDPNSVGVRHIHFEGPGA